MSATASDVAGSAARRSVSHLLFKPFAYIAGGRSLLVGLAAIMLAGFLGSLSHTHFDGAIDMHTGRPAATSVFLSEGLVNWLAMSVALFLLGKLVSRADFRALDLIGTQAMARWPTVLAALAALAPPYRRLVSSITTQALQTGGFAAERADVVLGGLPMLVALLTIVWMVALMYHSYSLCCNIRGARAGLSFVAALVAAEIVSKIVIVRVLLG